MGRAWLTAAIAALLPPLLAFLLFAWMTATLEIQWRDAVEAQYGAIPAEVADRVTLAALCADPGSGMRGEEVCVHVAALSALRSTAVGAAILGFVLLGIAGTAAAATQGSRRRMARVLPPGLRIILVATAAILAADAILVVGLLIEGMMVWMHRVFPWVIALAGIAGVASVAGALRAVAVVGRSEPLPVLGVALSREEEPALFAEVADVARALGVDPPRSILAGLEPSFFVVDAPVQPIGERLTGTSMFLSLPVCGLLTRGEFRAVVGHELGHLRGRDTEYTRRIAPLYSSASVALGSLTATSGRLSGLGTLPAAVMLRAVFTVLFANAAEAGRRRELEADQAAAGASSARDLGSSLVKLQLVSPAWAPVRDAVLRGAITAEPSTPLGASFLDAVRAVGLDAGIGVEDRIAHPFDTHPPLHERLAALGAAGSTGEVDLLPGHAAVELFANPKVLDAQLTSAIANRVRLRVRTSFPPQIFGASVTLRRAALRDPGISSLMTLLNDGRDPELRRPLAVDTVWVALTDLLAAPEEGWDFDWTCGPAGLPVGDQWAVVDVGDGVDLHDLVVPAGTRFRLVGILDADAANDEPEAHAYVALEGPWAQRLLVVTGVGLGDVRAQAAGLLVVPTTDPLASDDPADEAAVRRTAAMLRRTRVRDSDGRSLRLGTSA